MFSAKQTLADLDLKPFPFEDLDGVVRELPHLKSVGSHLLDKIFDGSLFEVVNELADEDTAAAVAAMPIGVATELAREWLAFSGLTEGETQASSRSGASTARPSKPTSRGSTASKTRRR